MGETAEREPPGDRCVRQSRDSLWPLRHARGSGGCGGIPGFGLRTLGVRCVYQRGRVPVAGVDLAVRGWPLWRSAVRASRGASRGEGISLANGKNKEVYK